MKKHLIFYWYVKPDGWCDIYDLHLKNCLLYRDIFDKVTIVISTDDNTGKELIKSTKERLLNIFNNAEIVDFKNDRELRESLYFHNEIIEKLNTFNEDEAIFFAHNKGYYTNYTSREDLIDWINCMYFCNLYYPNVIDGLLLNEDIITIGSCCVANYRAPHFVGCKYCWHYQGSFFWLIPSRLFSYIKKQNENLLQIDRYYTEKLFGSIFPFESKHKIALFGVKHVNEYYKDYIIKNFPEEVKAAYNDVCLKLLL